jgi:hypothetical protein
LLDVLLFANFISHQTYGWNYNIEIAVDTSMTTPILFAMLHADGCAVGVYEFGTVEGCDGPVAVDGAVVTPSFAAEAEAAADLSVPSVVMADQIALLGDNVPPFPMTMETPSVVAYSVVSSGPGFLVMHTDNGGAPGPVLGYAAVADGLNINVSIGLGIPGVALTAVMFPMLHVDTCEIGAYEFGTVEGCDGPVVVGDAVLTFPINVAPSMTFEDQALDTHDDGMTYLHIDSALIDAHGWMVIHSSADGAPGPVLNQYPLLSGNNKDIEIALDAAAAGAQVFPMLHYDTCEIGVYEFGAVEGCDAPVFVNEAVVVAPLAITQ